jgi:predicted solute-binding protein
MDANKGDRELSTEEAEKLARALGEAVARCWNSLPQEIQHNLFEAAVRSEGEIIRRQLALYLNEKHARTLAAIQA